MLYYEIIAWSLLVSLCRELFIWWAVSMGSLLYQHCIIQRQSLRFLYLPETEGNQSQWKSFWWQSRNCWMPLYSHCSQIKGQNDEMCGWKMNSSVAPEACTNLGSSEGHSSLFLHTLRQASPPACHSSAFVFHLGLGAMTGPSIIPTDWSLLIAIAVNYLDPAEITQ